MGQTLDSIIRYKQFEQERENQNQAAIVNAVGAFIQNRRARDILDIRRKEQDISLAKSGLRLSREGQIVPDRNLLTALNELDEPSVSDLKGRTLDKYLQGGELTPEQDKVLNNILPEKKGTYKERLSKDLQSAISEDMPWNELESKYPLESAKIAKLKPVAKNPLFKEGKGLKALFDPRVANITPTTQKVINNIKNQGDLDELIANEEDYRASGVDVKAILEYFGEE